MQIKDLQYETYHIAKEKGWYDSFQSVGDLIALCHSELSEALEVYRKKGLAGVHDLKGDNNIIVPSDFSIKLADLIIRVTAMATYLDINLELAIESKMAYNRTRPYRHGDKTI